MDKRLPKHTASRFSVCPVCEKPISPGASILVDYRLHKDMGDDRWAHRRCVLVRAPLPPGARLKLRLAASVIDLRGAPELTDEESERRAELEHREGRPLS